MYAIYDKTDSRVLLVVVERAQHLALHGVHVFCKRPPSQRCEQSCPEAARKPVYVAMGAVREREKAPRFVGPKEVKRVESVTRRPHHRGLARAQAR